jgi:hypothetical protein
MADLVDDAIRLALDDMLGGVRFPRPDSLPPADALTRRPRRRRAWRWYVPVVGLATLGSLAIILLGVGGGSGRSAAYVRHVGVWSFRVQSADAAVGGTATERRLISQSARATYLTLRRSYRQRGVYLATHPVVTFVGRSAETISVRFPSGTTLHVPDAPRDVWYAEVGAISDPTDATKQVDMLFASDGRLIRAFPRNSPELLGTSGLAAADLAGLQWTTVPVTMTEFPDTGCNGPACSTGTDVHTYPPNPEAQLVLQTASTPDGGTAFALSGTHLNPHDPYYLASGLGTFGSAQTDADGAVVAVITIDAATADRLRATDGGLVAFQGAGQEIFRACPFGGRLQTTQSLVSCQ